MLVWLLENKLTSDHNGWSSTKSLSTSYHLLFTRDIKISYFFILRENNSSETTQLCVDSTLSLGVKRELVGFGWNRRRSPERRNQNTFIIIHKAIKGRRKQRWEEKPCKSLLQCSHTHTFAQTHNHITYLHTHLQSD